MEPNNNHNRPPTPPPLEQAPTALAAINHIISIEGYESDDPRDPGGYTRWGISTTAHPDIDFETFTMKDAAEIYYRKYWIPMNTPLDLHQHIYNHLLSAHVLFGQHRASQCRQRALNRFGYDPPLHVDGVPGPQTKFATATIGSDYPAVFLLSFLLECKTQAALLVRQSPNLSCFLRGWLNRFDPPELLPAFLEARRS